MFERYLNPVENYKMKKTLIALLRSLTAPVRKNENFFIPFKDVVASHPSEHLFRTVRLIRKSGCVTQGKQVLDLGAADGSTTRFFATHFPECRITGFEPIAAMFKKAKETVRDLGNATVLNMACSDREGEADFHVSANFLSSSLLAARPDELKKESDAIQKSITEVSVEKVKTTRLDTVAKDLGEILLIKIDTQGTELMILQNGVETLKKTNFILAEVNNHSMYENTCQYYEVDAFLRGQGFRLSDLVVTYRDSKDTVKEFDVLYTKL